MYVPADRHLAFAALVFGLCLAAPARVHADCNGGGDNNSGDSSGSDPSQNYFMDPGGGYYSEAGNGFYDVLVGSNDSYFNDIMTNWNFFAVGDDSGSSAAQTLDANSSGWSPGNASLNVSVNALLTVYAGSPTPVSSIAFFTPGYPYGHTIDYINADDYAAGGGWTMNVDPAVSLNPDGSYSRTINVTYPTPGTYYVRAGGDEQSAYWGFVDPYYYSQTLTITALDPITNYTVAIQTHPKPGMEKWVLPSHQVTKPFQVFHSN
jgi:hypothetical protein